MPSAIGKRVRRSLRGQLVLAGALCSLPAWSQTPVDAPPADTTPASATPSAAIGGGRLYEPAFFARFAPKTAADMVNNIPGFDITSNGEERGFGQASQNVLINGRRVSGKSNDAQTALGRIAADTVQRIEIVDGATLDIPGLSGEVANVIATVDALSGSWFVQPEFRENLQPSWFNGTLSANGRTGGLSWSVGASAREFHNGHDGPGIITNGAGVVTDVRREGFNGAGEEPSIDATLTYETRAGSIANVNLSARAFNFVGREDSFRNPLGRPPESRFVNNGEDFFAAEIGADYDFQLGPGRLKLIALHGFENEDDDVRVETYAGASRTGQRVDVYAKSGESIGRAEYSTRGLGGDIQIAAEGAFNFLDLETALATLQANGDYVGAVLPDGTARVEERRGETNASYSRKLSPTWSLQSSLGVEYSELSQIGAGGLTREFVRPKGYAAFAWTASETTDVNLKLERRVGQLDFEDFLSSVDLQSNNNSSGNVDLVPEQSWIASTEINRKLGAWGAVKLVLEAHLVEDVVDLVPIGAASQGVGNVDEARRWLATTSGTINLDPLGLRGVQLGFNATVADSEVEDPLTGQTREISGSTLFSGDARIRWDVPETPWTFVVGIEEYRGAANYRLDQIGRNWTAPSTNFVWIEHKDVYGMKVRLMAVNLNDTSENYKREVYEGGRRTNALSFIEERYRTFGPIVRLNISGTF